MYVCTIHTHSRASVCVQISCLTYMVHMYVNMYYILSVSGEHRSY